MRYLALMLLAPPLLILCWGYWQFPRSLPRSAPRRAFDVLGLLLALFAAVRCALLGFDTVVAPTVDEFGRASGAIWQHLLPDGAAGDGGAATGLGASPLSGVAGSARTHEGPRLKPHRMQGWAALLWERLQSRSAPPRNPVAAEASTGGVLRQSSRPLSASAWAVIGRAK